MYPAPLGDAGPFAPPPGPLGPDGGPPPPAVPVFGEALSLLVQTHNARMPEYTRNMLPSRDYTHRMLGAQGLVLELANLEARSTAAAVHPDAELGSELSKVPTEVLQDMRSQHEDMPKLIDEYADPSHSLLHLMASTARAAGCSLLKKHEDLGINMSSALQLDVLRAGGYEHVPPAGTKEVTLELIHTDGAATPMWTHRVRDFDKLSEILEVGE